MKTVSTIWASALLVAAAPLHAGAPTIADQGAAALRAVQEETRRALRHDAATRLRHPRGLLVVDYRVDSSPDAWMPVLSSREPKGVRPVGLTP